MEISHCILNGSIFLVRRQISCTYNFSPSFFDHSIRKPFFSPLFFSSTSPSSEDLKETRSTIRSPRILSEILNEVPPPPREELRGDPRDKLTFSSTTTSRSQKIEDVITKSSDSDESKEPLRNRASEDYGLRSSPPPLELASKKHSKQLPFIVIQNSEQETSEMWESRGTAQVSYHTI